MKTIRMDKYSSPVSYAWGLICAFFGLFTLSEWAIVIGIVTTIGTFFINWYYKHKDYQRKAGHSEHDTEKGNS